MCEKNSGVVAQSGLTRLVQIELKVKEYHDLHLFWQRLRTEEVILINADLDKRTSKLENDHE